MKISVVLFLIMSTFLCAQNVIFSTDFSSTDLSAWTFYSYSTGLHGGVEAASVSDGELLIKTRDQQNHWGQIGDKTWDNYQIDFDFRPVEVYDDAANDFYLHFYSDSTLVTENGSAYFSGYSLRIRGRDGSWYARREYVDGTPVEGQLNGYFSIFTGKTYHIHIDQSNNKVNIYIRESGHTPFLLAELDLSSHPNSGGRVIFGGGDNLIAIDNIVIQANPLSISDAPNQLAGSGELYQNYPNPFNPETTISFNMAKSSPVTLTIYNSVGQAGQTLLNNQLLTAGTHDIHFDASNLTSGVYFYQLKTPDFSSVKRMILLK